MYSCRHPACIPSMKSALRFDVLLAFQFAMYSWYSKVHALLPLLLCALARQWHSAVTCAGRVC
jgi:hypothetical protein